MAWGQKVSEEFCRGVLEIARGYDWADEQGSHLMSSIAWETGETFSSSIRNGAGSGAVGLIQFMPAIAKGLGTTVENLELLSPEAQLYYVKKYFEPYARRIHTLSDMYMAILLPKYIGAPEDSVLFTDGTIAFRQNCGFDADKNGKITKLEATAKVQAKLDKGLRAEYARHL